MLLRLLGTCLFLACLRRPGPLELQRPRTITARSWPGVLGLATWIAGLVWGASLLTGRILAWLREHYCVGACCFELAVVTAKMISTFKMSVVIVAVSWINPHLVCDRSASVLPEGVQDWSRLLMNVCVLTLHPCKD